MSGFFVGQQVVCVDDSRTEGIKRDLEYPVKGMMHCPCGVVALDVGTPVPEGSVGIQCQCGNVINRVELMGRMYYNSKRFRPLESFGDHIMRNLKVEVPVEKELIMV